MNGGRSCRTQFWNGTTPAKFGLIWFSRDLNGSFIKICLICIIGKNRLKEKFQRKTRNICLTTPCYVIVSCSKYLSSFWLKLKQQWTIEEISIFSNSSHLEWRAQLSDTILKGTHPETIPTRLGLIWFSGFRGEDLNVKVYDVQQTPSDGKRKIIKITSHKCTCRWWIHFPLFIL